MVRVISQETFESVVKENVEEFGQTVDEAIEDAVQQFQAQGVDLTNIIKELILSDKEKNHIIIETIQHMKSLFDKNDLDKAQFTDDLNNLKNECGKDIAHKLMAAKEGAYDVILECVTKFQTDHDLLLLSMKTIQTLMDGQPDLLEDNAITIIKNLLEKQESNDIIAATLQWITISCWRHEHNRQAFFKADILTNLKNMMENHKDPTILTKVCTVLRNLVLDDDVRVEYGQAHEHARLIATETLHILTQMLADFKSHEKFVADILLTLAMVIVRNEFCQILDDAGGLQFILDVMVEFHDKEKIIRQCFKLLKALAGNDNVKRNIIKKGAAVLICSTLDTHKNIEKSSIYGLICVSALALREVENSKELFNTGLPEVILQCMNAHENSLQVQRNGSWAIRNIVTKCPEHREKFLEFNAEDLLNRALEKFEKEAAHDIKSALKDLGCNVKLNEQWTGKGGRIHTCAKD